MPLRPFFIFLGHCVHSPSEESGHRRAICTVAAVAGERAGAGSTAALTLPSRSLLHFLNEIPARRARRGRGAGPRSPRLGARTPAGRARPDRAAPRPASVQAHSVRATGPGGAERASGASPWRGASRPGLEPCDPTAAARTRRAGGSGALPLEGLPGPSRQHTSWKRRSESTRLASCCGKSQKDLGNSCQGLGGGGGSLSNQKRRRSAPAKWPREEESVPWGAGGCREPGSAASESFGRRGSYSCFFSRKCRFRK